MINLAVLNSVFSNHPYYAKLDDSQKIVVLNSALTKLYSKVKTQEKPIHSVFTKGYIGFNNESFDPDEIKKLPQMMLSAKSNSKYSDIDFNLSTTEFVKEFSYNERMILYRLAVAKISSRIKTEYSIEGMIGDIKESIVDVPLKLRIIYRIFDFITQEKTDIGFKTSIIARLIGDSYVNYLSPLKIAYRISESTEIVEINDAGFIVKIDYRTGETGVAQGILNRTKIKYYIKTLSFNVNDEEIHTSSLTRTKIRYSKS